MYNCLPDMDSQTASGAKLMLFLSPWFQKVTSPWIQKVIFTELGVRC